MDGGPPTVGSRPDPVEEADIFESALNLEEAHLKKGYDEGYAHGLVTGKEEAREVGLRSGFEVGEELGFYRGCVDVWDSVDPVRFSSRVRKAIGRVRELVEEYPLMDPEDARLQEIMDELRLRFRIVRAGLGVKLEYDGYPKPKDMEF